MSHSASRCWAYSAIGVLTLSATQGCMHPHRDDGAPAEKTSLPEPGRNCTTSEAIALVAEDLHILGTGLFLVPAPEVGPNEYAVTMVPDLTYDETTRRGHICPAFKFVPYDLEDYRELSFVEFEAIVRLCVTPRCPCAGPCVCGGIYCNAPLRTEFQEYAERLLESQVNTSGSSTGSATSD